MTTQRDRTRLFRALFLVVASSCLVGLAFVGGVLFYFSRGLPNIITVADYRPMGVTQIIAKSPSVVKSQDPLEVNEKELAAVPMESEQIMGEFFKERRYLVPFEKIPPIVVQAFIAAEDDRFFEHPGINVSSIVRAGIANFRAGHVVQGGSTITQQVAKSLLLTSERSFDRKIKEVILAGRIENNLTKNQILYLYLNEIYLGHGAYGVQAASKVYFGKDISQITVPEAALLAGLPQAPGKYSPLLNPKRAKERQSYVLRRMMENRFIPEDRLAQYIAQPVRIFHEESVNKKYAPYLVEHIRRHLIEKYGEKMTYEDGLTVHVPMSLELAKKSTLGLQAGLRQVDKRVGFRGPVRRLKKAEIDPFLEATHKQMILDRVQGQFLMPDGSMDLQEGLRQLNIVDQRELIDPNELYQGLVTHLNRNGKIAYIKVGNVEGELGLAQVQWAVPLRDEQNPRAPRRSPRSVAAILKNGDVIWVKKYIDPKAKSGSTQEDPLLQFELEQVPQVQGALFAMDVKNGHVLSMVGGYDFETSEFNRAVQAMRQPGSAYKPVIYAAALEKGYTPATLIVDSPLVFKDSDGAWKPSNYGEKFYGDTTFRQALIKSRNIPTVKLVQDVQVPRLIEFSKRLGMNAQFNSDLSIALGSSTVSLLELTRVYALFPRLGRKIEPIFVTRVQDRDGHILEEPVQQETANLMPPLPATTFASAPMALPAAIPTPEFTTFPTSLPTSVTGMNEGSEVDSQVNESANLDLDAGTTGTGDALAEHSLEQDGSGTNKTLAPYPPENDPAQVLDPRLACVMTHLMKEVVTHGTGRGASGMGRPAAGKTGTTNESVDAWFMGFTPQIVTGAWVGFDNQKSLGPRETGARAALPIWLDFMVAASEGLPVEDFAVPPGVVFANIDPATGRRVPENTPGSLLEAFVEGTAPRDLIGPNGSVSKEKGYFFKEDRE